MCASTSGEVSFSYILGTYRSSSYFRLLRVTFSYTHIFVPYKISQSEARLMGFFYSNYEQWLCRD